MRAIGRRIEVLLATAGERPVGYAIYLFTYSSFLARPTLFLEDVFVRPERRKLGIGRAFYRRLVREARRQGCGRMEWRVLDWNRPAHAFYRRLGARRLKEWLPYRVELGGKG